MTERRFPPTPAQQRLVNIGMLIQFHLAAIGHLAMWVWMYCELLRTDPTNEGYVIFQVFVCLGIPISFGILVAVYILFRCLLAYANFGIALAIMISLNVLHAGFMGLVGLGTGAYPIFIVPVRLAIPIILYSFACYHYHTAQLQERMQARENEESADVS